MQLGVDNLIQNHKHLLKNKRVGLLTHSAALSTSLESTLEILNKDPDINLVLLFGPEHGVFGTAQDMEGVASSKDPLTGLPIVSLYGNSLETLKPKKEDIKKIDVLICDLQDIGVRYYTYIYTLAFCMQTCAELGKKVIVLDRPNPLNGVDMEGNVLDKKYSSFVGWYSLPVRHGMTIGELAQYFNKEESIGCDLKVIPMKGWKREWYFDETGVTWTPPSPNMPKLSTAIVYPGGCLIEATQLSEGRGTTMPFEWIGAPYINARELADQLNELKLPEVLFQAFHFKPNFQKYADQECKGVQIHVKDRKNFKSFLTTLHIIQTIHNLYPKDFAWRDKAYEFVTNIPAIDLLCGCDTFRKIIEKRGHISAWEKTWEEDLREFETKRMGYLIYK